MMKQSKSSKSRVSTSVSIKRADGTEEVKKNGTPQDISEKQNAKATGAGVVGFGLGMTKNMGNYESLRIDVWGTTDIKDHNNDYNAAYESIIDTVTSVIEKVADEYNS